MTGDVIAVDERIITVCVVPYEQEAIVEDGGQIWTETWVHGALTRCLAALTDPSVIRVNREHDRGLTVGKVIALRDTPAGLHADLRIARTARGDETLALAREGCLSASIGAGARAGGIIRDYTRRVRRVVGAELLHIALVESPAYTGATVLAVRSRACGRPNLDALTHSTAYWRGQLAFCDATLARRRAARP